MAVWLCETPYARMYSYLIATINDFLFSSENFKFGVQVNGSLTLIILALIIPSHIYIYIYAY